MKLYPSCTKGMDYGNQRGYYSKFSPYAKYLISDYLSMINLFPDTKKMLKDRSNIIKNRNIPYSSSEKIDKDTKVRLLINIYDKKFTFETALYKSYHKHAKPKKRGYKKIITPVWEKRLFMKLGWLV